MPRWLHTARRAARKSRHPKYQMAAVIVSGGRVVALASNHSRWGHHAETRAIKMAVDTLGATIYIARSDGGPSLPCPMCQQAILAAGIRRVVAVDENRKVVIHD